MFYTVSNDIRVNIQHVVQVIVSADGALLQLTNGRTLKLAEACLQHILYEVKPGHFINVDHITHISNASGGIHIHLFNEQVLEVDKQAWPKMVADYVSRKARERN